MKITKCPSECSAYSGSTEISYTIDDVNRIKKDLKIHLDPIVALVFWVNREGVQGDARSIQMMWTVVENITNYEEETCFPISK